MIPGKDAAMKEKVVVTGVGAIASNGNNTDSFWHAIISGKDGYTDSRNYVEPDFPFKLCGKIKGFDPYKYLTGDEVKSLDRSAQLAVAAATMALQDSGLEFSRVNNKGVAVVMGTTCGCNLSIEENDFNRTWFENKTDVHRSSYTSFNHSSIPNAISAKFGFSGPSYLQATACASGNHCIGEGFDLIRLGKAKVVVCGGAEALSLLPMLGFNVIRSMAKEKCAPFDKKRDGIVVGEGSGVLILESLDHATQRNANIHAEVSGWGINCDAENIASPIVDGSRCAELIEKCLRNAEIDKRDIDYISLHGTGTIKNDQTEANAIKKVFGEKSRKIPASSIKSMIGHTFGAAGALEGVVSVLAIRNSCVPPNINLTEMDKGFELNLVTECYYSVDVEHVLSLSFGFGGCNVATIFSRFSRN